MQRTLYLVRHAEAEKPAGGPSDFTRILTSGGVIDAARMGRLLVKKEVKIAHLVASPAERCKNTAQVLAEQIGFDFDTVHLDETLYDGSPRQYLAALHALPDTATTVMIVGHNPSISYLAEYLCNETLGDVPTGGVVSIVFENQAWHETTNRSGKLLFYDSPEKLGGFNLF